MHIKGKRIGIVFKSHILEGGYQLVQLHGTFVSAQFSRFYSEVFQFISDRWFLASLHAGVDIWMRLSIRYESMFAVMLLPGTISL